MVQQRVAERQLDNDLASFEARKQEDQIQANRRPQAAVQEIA
jgi:hypothetical protein